MRFPAQAVEQINGDSSVVSGLVKRNPSNHIRRIIAGDVGTTKVHTIYRDSDQQFICVFTSNGVQVFDIATGALKTVYYGTDAAPYLQTNDPENDLRCVSVADYTFVVNRTKTVALKAATSAAALNDALVTVTQATNGAKYTVVLDGTSTVAITAATGESTAIAIQIRDGINGIALTPYTATASGSTVHIKRTTGTAVFSCSVSDSLANAGLELAKDSVASFTSLPTHAPDGFRIKVAGDPEAGADDYWVKFVSNVTGSFFQGVWVETLGPGLQYQFDPLTMPHVLIRNNDGTFNFNQGSWTDKLVGTGDDSELPSIVGQSLQNVAFFRNRLTLLAGENVVMSEAGRFFNLWRTTLTDLLDSDPIDVAVSHNQVSILYHAIPYFDRLTLIGEKVQFTLSGGQEALTPKNVSIQPSTEVEAAIYASPILVGKNVYFGFDRGSNTGLWEYFVAPDTDQLDASDLTVGIPTYIPGTIRELVGSAAERVLAIRTTGPENTIYVYKFYTNGGERVQSAWMKWEFASSAEVRGMAALGSKLYLVIYRDGDGLSLERIDLQSGLTDTDCDYLTYLDRRTEGTLVGYDSGTNKTTYALPYSLTDADCDCFMAASRWTSAYDGGEIVEHESAEANGTIVFDGDTTAIPMWFGLNYAQTYRMSKPFMRQQGAARIIPGYRYQIRRGIVSYHNSLYFKVRVIPEYRSPYTYVFTGRKYGTPVSEVGAQSLSSGQFQFAVMTANEQLTVELVNDLPFPSSLTAVDWIGDFTPYASR
jgi:hypothetical protein